VVTATLSSACCWVPLLLLAVGASAAGVSAILGPWRPAFIGAAVAMLGLGFYFAFIRRPVAGAECCTPDRAKGRRWQRITWCVSAVMVTAFVLFPHWGGRLVDASSAAEASAPPFQVRELVFQIDGMHCQACAAALTAELSKIEGVQGVNVDYATKTARLFASSQSAVARVQESAQRLGYRASARTPRP
jgi:copper chaperone CopZ